MKRSLAVISPFSLSANKYPLKKPAMSLQAPASDVANIISRILFNKFLRFFYLLACEKIGLQEWKRLYDGSFTN